MKLATTLIPTRFTIAEDGNITVADGATQFNPNHDDGTNGFELGGTLVTLVQLNLTFLTVLQQPFELNIMDGNILATSTTTQMLTELFLTTMAQ